MTQDQACRVPEGFTCVTYQHQGSEEGLTCFDMFLIHVCFISAQASMCVVYESLDVPDIRIYCDMCIYIRITDIHKYILASI